MTANCVLFGVLGLLWVLLSGQYSPLFLGLGLVSVAFVHWIVRRMGRADGGARLEVRLRLLATLRYGIWLFGQIVRANVEVARLALSPGMRVNPVVLRVPARQRTEVGRVLFANSITLTPGTVSVHLGEEEVEVHALTRGAAASLAGGEMGRRVAELEK